MKQIINIAVNNVKKSGIKAFVIVLLMTLSIFTMAVSYSFSKSSAGQVEDTTEELRQLSYIKVLPKSSGKNISMSTLELIKDIEGVEYILPQYNLSGLLEDMEGKPIYPITLNGFDFDKNVFAGASDYRKDNVSGIILPDISYTLLDYNITLRDYVGKEVTFTYEYVIDGSYEQKQITCAVFGVYSASGVFEENPVYMSLDLFEEILKDMGGDISGVPEVMVYLEDVDVMNNVGETLDELGLDVYYQTTLKDYIKSLEGFMNFVMVISSVLIVLVIIIIVQAILANLKKRSTIIGVLKAYGYSNTLICFMVWLEIFIYSMISLLISICACVVLKSKINAFFAFFMPNVGYSIEVSMILLQVFVAIGVSVISAIIPIRRLRKINVIDVLKSS